MLIPTSKFTWTVCVVRLSETLKTSCSMAMWFNEWNSLHTQLWFPYFSLFSVSYIISIHEIDSLKLYKRLAVTCTYTVHNLYPYIYINVTMWLTLDLSTKGAPSVALWSITVACLIKLRIMYNVIPWKHKVWWSWIKYQGFHPTISF